VLFELLRLLGVKIPPAQRLSGPENCAVGRAQTVTSVVSVVPQVNWSVTVKITLKVSDPKDGVGKLRFGVVAVLGLTIPVFGIRVQL
jgi:hypothetical protein